MSTVHIFSKPKHYYSENTVSLVDPENDKVLLTGDACYDQQNFKQEFKNIFVLQSCNAIRLNSQLSAIEYIDDIDWVALLANHKSITW